MDLLISCIQDISLLSPSYKQFLKFLLNKQIEESVNSNSSNYPLMEQANDEGSLLVLDKKPIENIAQTLKEYLPLFNQNYSKLKPLYIRLIERIDSFITDFPDNRDLEIKDCYFIFKIASAHLAFDNLEKNKFSCFSSKLQSKLNVSEIDKDDSGCYSYLSNNSSNEIEVVNSDKSVSFSTHSLYSIHEMRKTHSDPLTFTKTFNNKHEPLVRCKTDVQRTESKMHIGMTDVPNWLNQLRLKKYINTIAGLSYEEMMSITDDDLIKRGVISIGARGKIIREIEKLKNRSSVLNNLKQTINFNDKDKLSILVKDLYEMSWTPMKRIYSLHKNEDSNNLANSFLLILHHVKEALKNFKPPYSVEPITVEYIQLLDKLLSKNFFKDSEKNDIKSWRLELINLNENIKLKFVTPVRRIQSLKTKSYIDLRNYFT